MNWLRLLNSTGPRNELMASPWSQPHGAVSLESRDPKCERWELILGSEAIIHNRLIDKKDKKESVRGNRYPI